MEMVISLVVMVSKLSSEVQQLRIDSETLKTQLRDETSRSLLCHQYDVLHLSQEITLRQNHIGMLCVQWVVTLVPQLRLGMFYQSRPSRQARTLLMAILQR
jgi:hypothetical protein